MRNFTKLFLSLTLLCIVGVAKAENVYATFESPTGIDWDAENKTFSWSSQWGNQLHNIGLPNGNLMEYEKLVVDCEIIEGDGYRLMFYATNKGTTAGGVTIITESGKKEFLLSEFNMDADYLTTCSEICLSGYNASGTVKVNEVYLVKASDPLAGAKKVLMDAITLAKAQSSFGKTTASWSAMQNALASAEAEYAKATATAESLEAVTTALNNAINALALADGYTNLTAAMFLKYASVEEPGEGTATGCSFELNKASDLPYGDGNVGELNWADLSGAEKLYIVTSGDIKPRLCLNRLVAGGQQAATKEDSQMLDINPNNDFTWSTEKYMTAEDGVYALDVKKIVADYGFARLHSIKKQGWGTGVTVTGLYLFKTPVKPDEPAAVDPVINDSDPAIVANKAALLSAINKAKAIDLTYMKVASATVLLEAIATGEALLNAQGGTVAALDAARRAILQAIDELEPKATMADIAEKEVPEGWENMITNGNFATDDMSSFFMVEPGKDLSPAVRENGTDQQDWYAAVVRSQDNPSQDWDTQFFIRAKEILPEGTKIHVEFDYRSDVEGSADTQSHKEPTAYIHWACIGSPTFKTEWQHWSQDVTVNADMAKDFQTIAFNLAKNKVATTFYFDNIVFWAQKPAPVEKKWKDIIVNGNMEGSQVVNFASKSYPSTAITPSELVAGVGKDGSKGIKVESPAKVSQDWDSQFWIVLPYSVPAGTKIKLSFDYKASAAATVGTQAHEAPGNYIHWACIGDVSFTTEWQTFDKEFSVPSECNGELAEGGFNKNFRSIAFNLTKDADITYFIDNVKLELDEDVIATSIKSVQPAVISNDALFDLQGRRIAKPGKGLYIKNGKKMLVK
jgi:hypothetical protein